MKKTVVLATLIVAYIACSGFTYAAETISTYSEKYVSRLEKKQETLVGITGDSAELQADIEAIFKKARERNSKEKVMKKSDVATSRRPETLMTSRHLGLDSMAVHCPLSPERSLDKVRLELERAVEGKE